MKPEQPSTDIDRRAFLVGGMGLAVASFLPLSTKAAPADMQAAVKELFGDRPLQEGGVTITIHPLRRTAIRCR